MTDKTREAWKLADEFLPFHPSASHVSPDYRDGWNACFAAAERATPSQGWMDIGTAPKDGTRVVLHSAEWQESMAVGWYSKNHEEWIICGGGPFLGPTHWMPLPPPPLSAKESEL